MSDGRIFSGGILRALFAIVVACTSFACNRRAATPGVQRQPATQSGVVLAVPEHGIYTGAYIEFGDREDDVTLEKIEAFEQMVGKEQAIIASSSYWGEQTFPTANARLIARHGSVPLIFWSPWDRPYVEGRGPDKYSLTSIVAGEHDEYIDRWADAAKAHGGPMMVSFCNEMNGSWFPWSGVLYGGGKMIAGGKPDSQLSTLNSQLPPRFEGPELFKKVWRHVVDRVRARGAKNVLWVFHVMDYCDPLDHWNMAAQYYPGGDYVDWMGFSLYGIQFPSDAEWAPFFDLFDWPYTELARIDPDKPIMLCEWGVGEFPKKGDKGAWIRDGFRIMAEEKKYPRMKAAVYWNERWQNSATDADAQASENAGKYSDLRVNSSPGAIEAYRQSAASPFFLADPILVPAANGK